MNSFSLWVNTSKLISTNCKENSESLRSIDGLRAFSLLWVIIGHRYGSLIMSPNINNIDVLHVRTQIF